MLVAFQIFPSKVATETHNCWSAICHKGPRYGPGMDGQKLLTCVRFEIDLQIQLSHIIQCGTYQGIIDVAPYQGINEVITCEEHLQLPVQVAARQAGGHLG